MNRIITLLSLTDLINYFFLTVSYNVDKNKNVKKI